MNAPVNIPRARQDADARTGIIDCDIHPFPRPGALTKYLPQRWRDHIAEYGQMTAGIYAARGNYPRFQPYLSRRDSVPIRPSVRTRSGAPMIVAANHTTS